MPDKKQRDTEPPIELRAAELLLEQMARDLAQHAQDFCDSWTPPLEGDDAQDVIRSVDRWNEALAHYRATFAAHSAKAAT